MVRKDKDDDAKVRTSMTAVVMCAGKTMSNVGMYYSRILISLTESRYLELHKKETNEWDLGGEETRDEEEVIYFFYVSTYTVFFKPTIF